MNFVYMFIIAIQPIILALLFVIDSNCFYIDFLVICCIIAVIEVERAEASNYCSLCEGHIGCKNKAVKRIR